MRNFRRLLAALLMAATALSAAAFASGSGGYGGNESVNYTYDAKGRLVKVEHSGTVNNGLIANYAYDKADNRANLNVTGSPN